MAPEDDPDPDPEPDPDAVPDDPVPPPEVLDDADVPPSAAGSEKPPSSNASEQARLALASALVAAMRWQRERNSNLQDIGG